MALDTFIGGLHPLLEYVNGGTLEKLIRQYYKIDTYFDENKRLITNQMHNNYNTDINHNNSYKNNLNSKYLYCPRLYRLNDANRTFAKLAEDVARGMDYLHSLHYLHRDLTSKNVLIRKLPPICDDTDEFDAEPYLVAVIGDFGFATSEPTADQKLPTVGSPYWMAPECIKGQWFVPFIPIVLIVSLSLLRQSFRLDTNASHCTTLDNSLDVWPMCV